MNDLTIMKNWVQSEFNLNLPNDVFNLISQKLQDTEYNSNLDVTNVAYIIHKLSEIPWYTQNQILNDLKINKDKLNELNKIIYDI